MNKVDLLIDPVSVKLLSSWVVVVKINMQSLLQAVNVLYKLKGIG